MLPFFYFPSISCFSFFLLATQTHHSHVGPHSEAGAGAVQGLGPGTDRQRPHCSPWAACLPSSHIPHGEQVQCASLSASGAVLCLSSSPVQASFISVGGLNPDPRFQHCDWGHLGSCHQPYLLGLALLLLVPPWASSLSLRSPFGFHPGLGFLPG